MAEPSEESVLKPFYSSKKVVNEWSKKGDAKRPVSKRAPSKKRSGKR